jgi:hypothetical protein
MTTYANDTTAQLISLLRMMTKDKKALLRDGFAEAANQNQQVIQAIMTELQRRQVA